MDGIRTKANQLKIRPKVLVADKAYGSKENRTLLRKYKIKSVIPWKSNQQHKCPHNQEIYKK